MEKKAVESKKSQSILPKIILSIIIIFIVTGIFFVKKTHQPLPEKKPVQNVTPTTIPVIRNAKFMLVSQSNQKIFLNKQTFKLLLIGDSDKNPILGYDIIIKYDPGILKFIALNNGDNNFDLLPTQNKPGTVAATGIIKKNIKTGTILKNTVLASLEFQPIKETTFQVDFIFNKGETDDTNIVSTDTNSNDILGQVNGFSGYIGKSIILTKQSEKKINDDLSVKLAGTDIPDKLCRDCGTTITINATEGETSKDMIFTSGGIMGKSFETNKFSDYIFEIEKYDKAQVVIRCAKQI